MNYKGIDISCNNGSINFESVAKDGVQIVYVKSSEGVTFKDSTMATFYEQAKAQNLKLGAYHFLVSTSDAKAQAQAFYNRIKDYTWDALPVVDVEKAFDGLSDALVDFITEWKNLSPMPLAIYTYTSFITCISGADDIIKDMPFWEANYNKSPWNLADNLFTDRVGHQYTETGSVSGVSENCDVDVFTEGILLTESVEGTWELQDNKYWYKHTDGSYTKDGWELIDNSWYLFDSEGYMIYDWKKDGANWYYFGGSDDGKMKTSWYYDKIACKWYYFSSDGEMQTGWVQVDNKWYYLDKSGVMQTGWLKDANNWYCLYSDGSMMCNCDQYGYHFDDKGVATKIN
jgi:GH25 family lysozyme M1 (1,4-beta-N-acetylmuramidase)